MKLQTLSASVVVVAEEQDPTILHPAFLSSQGIVPAEWQLAEKAVCMQVFAMAKYENGIVFALDPAHLQVIDSRPPADVRTSQVAQLASRYIEKLPHVHYSAAGINLDAFAPYSDPARLVLSRFLKRGPWNQGALRPKAISLTFVYQIPGTTLRLTCDVGKIKPSPEKEEEPAVLVKANYHKDLAEANRVSEAVEFIKTFPQRCEHFDQVASTVFGLE